MSKQVAFVHLEIVHPDPEAAAQYMIEVFGGERVERGIAGRIEEYIPGIKVVHVLVGGVVFQFVRPNENLASWNEQLQADGPSIHNVSFSIDDYEGVKSAMEQRGGSLVMEGDLPMQDLLGYEGAETFKGCVVDAREQIGMRWEFWEGRAGWVGGGTAP